VSSPSTAKGDARRAAPATWHHQVAGLQHWFMASPGAAAHKTEMTPMFPRHQLNDGTRLAMAAGAEHDTDIGPLHGVSVLATTHDEFKMGLSIAARQGFVLAATWQNSFADGCRGDPHRR
jgi:hypothetical protein